MLSRCMNEQDSTQLFVLSEYALLCRSCGITMSYRASLRCYTIVISAQVPSSVKQEDLSYGPQQGATALPVLSLRLIL